MLVSLESVTSSPLFWPALVAALTAIWFLIVSRSQFYLLLKKIPGPPGLPIIGNVLDFYVAHEKLCDTLQAFCEQFPEGILKAWLVTKPYVFVYEAKYVETIFSSSRHLNKSHDYTFLEPWLGTGLLTSTGDKWRSRRKLLTPSFHFRILEDFLPVFNEQSQILLQHLAKEAGKDSFDIFPYITRCTLDIICDTAMGRNINAQEHKDSDYVKAVYRIGDIIQSRQLHPWLWPDWIFQLTAEGKAHKKNIKILHSFTDTVIQEKKQQLLKEGLPKVEESSDVFGKKTRMAFLDLLLTASDGGRVLSDEDIREEVDTFMFEGHDTTAAGISWALYLLGINLQNQAKVHEELDGIFGDSDRPCQPEDLREMKYLECVIKESLRLFPSVPLIARHLKENLQMGKYVVPAGTTLGILPFILHRNSSVFPDPEAFIPERFLPDNSKGRHPYAYVPFSAGPRNCIGQKFALMEEKIVLSTVLRKYQIQSLQAREDMKLLAELILRPLGGILVKLTERQSKI